MRRSYQLFTGILLTAAIGGWLIGVVSRQSSVSGQRALQDNDGYSITFTNVQEQPGKHKILPLEPKETANKVFSREEVLDDVETTTIRNTKFLYNDNNEIKMTFRPVRLVPVVPPTMPGRVMAMQNMLLANSENQPLRADIVDAMSNKHPVQMLHMNGKIWTYDKETCSSKFSPPFKMVFAKTPHWTFPIYIHDPKSDVHVSGSLSRDGIWESDNIKTFITLLNRHPKAAFLDIGSNLGLYSLIAAKMGHFVIAVEPLIINLQRICRSVQHNKLTNKIIVIRNALSDEIRNVSMAQDPQNVGGSFVIENNKPQSDSQAIIRGVKYNDVIQTSKLDDLLNIPGFNISEAIFKIDVEGYEHKVLAGGKKFFDSVSVQAVMMEWLFHRQGESKNFIFSFFKSRSFVPRSPYNVDIKMQKAEALRWGTDILWLKVRKKITR